MPAACAPPAGGKGAGRCGGGPVDAGGRETGDMSIAVDTIDRLAPDATRTDSAVEISIESEPTTREDEEKNSVSPSDDIERLDAVRGRLAANSPPWAYVARNAVHTKGRGAEFRSGMTNERAKAMGRDIKNLFLG